MYQSSQKGLFAGQSRYDQMKNLWPGCRGSSANSSPSGRLIHILAGLTHIPALARFLSHYTLKAADLACGGHQVQLILHVRKFFCTNRECPRKIFVERLTAFLQPWARLTTRLGEQIEAIGLASCGRLGARLGSRLKIEISRTSILRRVMKLASKT